MDGLSKIGTVWPFLMAKVDELCLGVGATQALVKWRSDIMSMPQFAGHPLNVHLLNPNEAKELNKMTLADLCSSNSIFSDVVAERTDHLMMELRIIATVACKFTILAPTALGYD
jgi:hypothetical protein